MVYFEITSTDNFIRYAIGDVNHLIISNDGANPVTFSNDGSNSLGRINSGETITFDFINECNLVDLTSLYIKTYLPAAFTSLRVWAW